MDISVPPPLTSGIMNSARNRSSVLLVRVAAGVDLIQVEPVGAQGAQAGIQRGPEVVAQGVAAQELTAWPHQGELAGQDNLPASMAQRAANNLLSRTVGAGGVDEGDARVGSGGEHGRHEGGQQSAGEHGDSCWVKGRQPTQAVLRRN